MTHRVAIHPLWLRIWHWINLIAVVMMVTSGWQVYNASPIFGQIRFPASITLGRWLGGALLWHFAAMWLLALNLALYIIANTLTRRWRRRFFPLTPASIWTDLRAALTARLSHDDLSRYNAVQKLAYLFVLFDLSLLIASGLALWKPVQLPFLRDLLGGFDDARVVHFFAMVTLVGFVAVHVVMVAIVPRSLLTMIRGK
ncbi:thiosulfate reductase cytochrome b subunit [Paraburkholderia sp. CI2]|uniref:cytochrome b/b6 domain-containing protein n=1 Tax=Paraburkholderia sp. CI2 TaxID=2723093 RepID=UPI001619A9E9|nr:cytochrome b/b6 domain-containing protein [Paraburkholderia sp. CI2]MBB5466798.1 thiosulfate reductase cytochrome b subunit [Paraburkholderia sp. CI2]